MIELISSSIEGCYEIQPRIFNDERGQFVKVFHKNDFLGQGLNADYAEEYYSISKKNVIRGIHFQIPPEDHVKIVYCVAGDVIDVVVDLRKDSPTYGKCAVFSLSAKKANCIYIPKGMGHGFCARSDSATLVYKVSTVHSVQHDSGILWNSLDVDWGVDSPIVSKRDQEFISLSDFKSPF